MTFTSKNARGKTATKVMISLKAQFYKCRIGESHSRTDFTNHPLESIMTLLIVGIL